MSDDDSSYCLSSSDEENTISSGRALPEDLHKRVVGERMTNSSSGTTYLISRGIAHSYSEFLCQGIRESDGKGVSLKITGVSKLHELNDTFHEVMIITSLDHPNIVRLYDCFVTPSHFVCLAMSSFAKTLPEWLEERPSDLKRKRAVLDFLSGVVYLHGENIIHHNLKPLNVIMDSDRPIIIDFGKFIVFFFVFYKLHQYYI